jgi:hypothetical protein
MQEEGVTFEKREISSLTHVHHLEGSGGHLNSIFCFSF